MAIGKQRHDWMLTAQSNALLVNVNRARGSSPVSPAAFLPERFRPPVKRIKPSEL